MIARGQLRLAAPLRVSFSASRRSAQTLAAMGGTAREASQRLRELSRNHDSFRNGRLLYIADLANREREEGSLRALKGAMAIFADKKVALSDHTMCRLINTFAAAGGEQGLATVHDFMRRGDHGLRATPLSVLAFLKNAAALGKAEGVRDAIGWLKLRHRADISTGHYRYAVFACLKAGHGAMAYRLLRDAKAGGVRLPPFVYASVAALNAEDPKKLAKVAEAARAAGAVNASLEKVLAAAEAPAGEESPEAGGGEAGAAEHEGEGEAQG